MSEPWRDSFHSAVGNKNPEAMKRAVSEGMPLDDPDLNRIFLGKPSTNQKT